MSDYNIPKSHPERWRTISELDYEVSDQGRIRHTQTQRIRKLTHDKGGYLTIVLKLDGKYRRRRVHKLVLEAFVGPSLAGIQCRHRNSVPSDNRLANLAWGTPVEDKWDKHLVGRMPHGERHGNAKLTWKDVEAIRQAQGPWGLVNRLAQKYSVSHRTISDIRTGKGWRPHPLDVK